MAPNITSPTNGRARGALTGDRFARPIGLPDTAARLQHQAQDLLDILAANGGQVTPQPPRFDGLPSFIVDYLPGADRKRCRAALADAKNGAGVLAAMLVIARAA